MPENQQLNKIQVLALRVPKETRALESQAPKMCFVKSATLEVVMVFKLRDCSWTSESNKLLKQCLRYLYLSRQAALNCFGICHIIDRYHPKRYCPALGSLFYDESATWFTELNTKRRTNNCQACRPQINILKRSISQQSQYWTMSHFVFWRVLRSGGIAWVRQKIPIRVRSTSPCISFKDVRQDPILLDWPRDLYCMVHPLVFQQIGILSKREISRVNGWLRGRIKLCFIGRWGQMSWFQWSTARYDTF